MANAFFTVKIAKDEDFEFIVSSQMKMALETEGLNLDLVTVQKGVRAVLDDSSKGCYYIAFSDLNNVKAGMLLTVPEWSDWRNGTVLWIHSVYVIQDYRKKGVYSSLYNFLKDKVENSNTLRGLRLYVDKRNLVAQKTYKHLGMDNQHYELYEWLK